jgi:rhodanese-related sulfurtransferase
VCARVCAAPRAPTLRADFDPDAHTVVLCHHGVRSRSVADFLVSRAGFTNVSNISGGIDAYSRRVDGSVPLY